MTKDKALDLALKFVEANHFGGQDAFELITAIKQARSAPEQELSNLQRHEQNVQKFLGAQPAPVQEPVAWMDVDENGAMSSLRYWSEPDNRHEVALYTTPSAAQRQWVGLTDEEIDDLAEFHGLDFMSYDSFTRAIEAKLMEKNT